MSSTAPTTRLLAAVAAFGLDSGLTLPTTPLDPERWASLLEHASSERIEGLLAAAVAEGALPVDDLQRGEVREAARGRASVDLLLEREMLRVATVLGAAGVAYRVLKGQAWANTIYPDPSWRGSGDVDVLVADDEWYAAIAALERAGAERPIPEIRPGFDRRFGKEATMVSAVGWEIDLHRTFVIGPFGLWVDRSVLFDRVVHTVIGGQPVPTLDLEASFLHACFNAALADDPPRLIAIRDVCQLAGSERIDPLAVEEMTRRWRAAPVVTRALELAEQQLGATLWAQPVAVAFAHRRHQPHERALMAAYRGPARGYATQAATVVALPGVRERVAYLRALAFPQPAYLAARGWAPGSHLRIGGRRLLRSGRARAMSTTRRRT